jgi:hypothetical protein
MGRGRRNSDAALLPDRPLRDDANTCDTTRSRPVSEAADLVVEARGQARDHLAPEHGTARPGNRSDHGADNEAMGARVRAYDPVGKFGFVLPNTSFG